LFAATTATEKVVMEDAMGGPGVGIVGKCKLYNTSEYKLFNTNTRGRRIEN